LTTVTRTTGSHVALKRGEVVPRTFRFAFEDVDPLIAAFRRMVRERAYDISELAITTYVVARSAGKKITALPIFLVRGFHHGAILVNTKIVREPKDLEGKKVGVNRGYTVTTGVWVRGILQSEYGVDLDRITWVLSGDEHVAEYVPPANVVPIEPGKDIAQMVIDGELAGAIGIDVDHPDVKPLIPNAAEAGMEMVRTRGVFPINHLVVVKDELLAEFPELAADVFDAFVRAKQPYLDRLRAGTIEKPTAADTLHRRVLDLTGADPLPYGIEPNRTTLQALVDYAAAQRIVPAAVAIEDLFAPSTRGLAG
jgi:4,5-dihydroxyphthalate decarboxylase